MWEEVKPVRYSNKLLIFHFESLRCTSSSCYQFSTKRDWFRSEHCSSFSAKLIFSLPTIVFTRHFSVIAAAYWLCRADCFQLIYNMLKSDPFFALLSSHSCHNLRCFLKNVSLPFQCVCMLGMGWLSFQKLLFFFSGLGFAFVYCSQPFPFHFHFYITHPLSVFLNTLIYSSHILLF